MTKPRNKVLFHLTICVLSWLILIKPLIHYMEGFGPLGKAISEISITDAFYSKFVKTKPSDDIYIIDIGELPDNEVRQYVSNFLKEVNIKHQPKVIGVDLYFDKSFSNTSYDSILQKEISYDNIVRACKLKELDHIEYISPSELDLRYDFNNSDGYTNALGGATNHPCVRDYLPQKLIEDKLYNDFSVLVSKKANSKSYNEYLNDINPLSRKPINYNVSFKNNIIDIKDKSRYSELRDKIVLIGICTYDKKGTPKFTDDTWYTPLNKLYVGRSQKDMYGIEIKATIISNIINGDFINYSEGLSKRTNLFISIIIYFILITLFMKMHESFVFIKVFSQSFGVLFLAMINIIIMSSTSLYIDLTAAIGVMFFAPEIVELIEEISEKYNLYEVTTKLKSNIYSFVLSIKNK